MKIFEVIKEDKNTLARYGFISLRGNTYETPMFMPVGTQATVKGMTPEMVKECGSAIILANTYHLWERPGEDIVYKAGGLHKFMNYDGPMLTDSGGFQVFSLAKPKDIKEEGVYFKSTIDGKKLFLSPEKSIQIQEKLGADIIISFDECPPYPVSREYMKNSVERTLRWAKRGKDVHTTDQLLFGVVQGGEFSDLREYVYSGLYGGNNQELIYKRWFTDHKVTQEELEREKNENFEYQPLISIIVPTYNTPIIFLKE